MFQRLHLYASVMLTLFSIAVSWQMLTAQPGSMFATTADHIKWSYEVKQVGDDEFDLIFRSDLTEGWYIYGPYQDYVVGEVVGPIPMSITYDSRDKFVTVGKLRITPRPKKLFDDMFEMDIYQVYNNPVFVQRIRVKTEEPFTIKGTIAGQICLNSCINFEDDFTLNISGARNVGAGGGSSDLNDEGDEDDENLSGEREGEEAAVKGAGTGADDASDGTKDKSLLAFFLVALALGLAGIFTPCVFPMIPMNIAFFLNYQGGKSKGKFLALFYGLSIIFIYSVLGLLITVIFGAQTMGIIVSHWLTNVIFFLVFVFFAASFFGAFELVLPSKWVNKADAQADRGGLIGTFFMALTLVLVSFSCTAAFIGAILVEATAGGTSSLLKPFVGMLGFSVGFGVPFAFLALFPAALDKMPKSGGWMNSIKVVFGFIILAFGLKFLIVPDQTLHLGILTRDIYLAIWITLFTLMGLYLLGVYRFSHDSELKHIGFFRLLVIVTTFSFVVYLIPGLFGADLRGVSSFLPPKVTQQFDLSAGTGGPAQQEPSNICGTPTRPGNLKLPHNLQGYFDWEEAMACARELNKPVFIDFTGHSCTNCKKMENRVWSDPRVLQRLRNDVVILALYNDDKSPLPEERWVTTESGREIRTYDRLTRHIQETRFGSVAVPFYVVVDPDGNMLSGPYGTDYNVENFIAFLDEGINRLKANNREQ